MNRVTFDMFLALAGFLKETKPGPRFSHMVQEHLCILSKEFELYFPKTVGPQNTKKCICDPFVNMPGCSSMSLLEETQLLDIANDGGLKSMFESTLKLIV